MKIADIGVGKAVLEELIDKKRTQKQNASSSLVRLSENRQDSFENGKRIAPDLARMNELQKNYLKDTTGLKGLVELRERAESFDAKSGSFEKLSQELNAIVSGTKYQGENIISYLSTHIGDDKALYTFKSSLGTEIDNIKLKISSERKDIAAYLVKEENLEGMKGYIAESSVQEIASALDARKTKFTDLHRNIPNIQSLLGIEK